jgi:glycosyltransferase involved in cell wall biosynthesis
MLDRLRGLGWGSGEETPTNDPSPISLHQPCPGARPEWPVRRAANDGLASWARPAARISCIVCAYNEAERIRYILDAVYRHPWLTEVIVVNDGSTDDTEAALSCYPDVRLISYTPNRGKTHALCRGIAAARGDYLMLLDADLTGVSAEDIEALAEPVVSGRAEVSISLRRNSLALYRLLGLDFVSGERVIPAWMVAQSDEAMECLPRWGGEAYLNDLIIGLGLSVAVVDWPRVFNIRKYAKLGAWRGMVAELAMVSDALRVLSPLGVVRQNLALLRLVRKPPGHFRAAMPSRPIRSAASINMGLWPRWTFFRASSRGK